jgi:hypothetical protein
MSNLVPGDLVVLIADSRVQYFCEACGADVRKYIGEVGEVMSPLLERSSHCPNSKLVGSVHVVKFADGYEQTFLPRLLRKIEPPKDVMRNFINEEQTA